ncbi:MAG: hypothetical protein IIX24_05545 [Peptococcaceae bacterium]|nr:hypothetical protein [Peptococcaceae bacterium]
MRIKKETIHNTIVWLALISQAMTWVGLPLKINILISVAVALTTFSMALAGVLLFFDRKGPAYRTNDLVLLAALVIIVVWCVMGTASINIETVQRIILFFQMPFLMLVARRANKGGRVRDIVYTINACYPILFLYYYNSDFVHRIKSEYGDGFVKAFTLGFANPNETAMYLMVCAFLLLAAFFHYKTLYKRILFGLDFLLISFLIYKTECRIVILLMTLVLLGVVFGRKIKVGRRFIRCCFLASAGFTVILLAAPAVGRILIMNEVADTGRYQIFSRFFYNLTATSLMVGDFLKYPLNNMHNAFLGIFASFGIIVALYCWAFFCRGFSAICGEKAESLEYSSLQLGCCAIILHSAVEAAMFLNGAIYADIVFLMLFMTASADNTKVTK